MSLATDVKAVHKRDCIKSQVNTLSVHSAELTPKTAELLTLVIYQQFSASSAQRGHWILLCGASF